MHQQPKNTNWYEYTYMVQEQEICFIEFHAICIIHYNERKANSEQYLHAFNMDMFLNIISLSMRNSIVSMIS